MVASCLRLCLQTQNWLFSQLRTAAPGLRTATASLAWPRSLWLDHSLCGQATRPILDLHRGRVCGRWAPGARRYVESLKPLVHTHTHAQDRYPALWYDEDKETERGRIDITGSSNVRSFLENPPLGDSAKYVAPRQQA